MTRFDLLQYGALQDLHTHTTYCDGKNTPREMIEAAMEKGLRRIGFSGHSPSPCPDEDYAMARENVPAYVAEVRALAEEYKGRIEVLCGIEQDVYSPPAPEGLDYIIGSVHYVKVGDGYFAVDISPEDLARNCQEHFGGDYIALCEAYFAGYEQLAKLEFDIVGHIDLISKFNRGGKMFDEQNERYLAAARRAVDVLIPTGALFEINTGAMSRGYRDAPYPAPAIYDYIREKGGKFILSGDTHRAENLCYAFDEWGKLV